MSNLVQSSCSFVESVLKVIPLPLVFNLSPILFLAFICVDDKASDTLPLFGPPLICVTSTVPPSAKGARPLLLALTKLPAPKLCTACLRMTNSPGVKFAFTVSLLPLPGTKPPLANPKLFLLRPFTAVVNKPIAVVFLPKAVVFRAVDVLLVAPDAAAPAAPALLPASVPGEDFKPPKQPLPNWNVAAPSLMAANAVNIGRIGLIASANLIRLLVVFKTKLVIVRNEPELVISRINDKNSSLTFEICTARACCALAASSAREP